MSRRTGSRTRLVFVCASAILSLALVGQSARASELTTDDVAAGMRAADLIFALLNGQHSGADLEPVLVPSLRNQQTYSALDQVAEEMGSIKQWMAMGMTVRPNSCQQRRYAVLFGQGLGSVNLTLCAIDQQWLIQGVDIQLLTSALASNTVQGAVAQSMGLRFHESIDCSQADAVAVDETFSCQALSQSGVLVDVQFEKRAPDHIVVAATQRRSKPLVEITDEQVAQAGELFFQRLLAGEISQVYAEASHTYRMHNEPTLLVDLFEALAPSHGRLTSATLLRTGESDWGDPLARFRLSFERGDPFDGSVVLIRDRGRLRLQQLLLEPTPDSVASRVILEAKLDLIVRHAFSDPVASVTCPHLPVVSLDDDVHCQAEVFGDDIAITARFGAQGWSVSPEPIAARVLSGVHAFQTVHGWELEGMPSCSPGPATGLREYRCILARADGDIEVQVVVQEPGLLILDARNAGQEVAFAPLTP